MLGSLSKLLEDETFNNNSLILAVFALYITLRIISTAKRERVQLYYKKMGNGGGTGGGHLLGRDFVRDSGVREMHYTPYMLTINGHIHTLFYLIVEGIHKMFFKVPFERELFKLSDGG
jgi:hypothetical protein